MLQRFDGRPFKGRAGHVADVADGFGAFWRGVVAAGSEVAEAFEEARGFLERGFGLQDRDVVAERGLLIDGKIGEWLLKAALRFSVDPGEAIEDRLAITGLRGIGRADPLVDEVRHTDGGGAGRGAIGGDDDIAQGMRGAALRLGEGEWPHIAGLIDFYHARIGAVALRGDRGIGGEKRHLTRG